MLGNIIIIIIVKSKKYNIIINLMSGIMNKRRYSFSNLTNKLTFQPQITVNQLSQIIKLHQQQQVKSLNIKFCSLNKQMINTLTKPQWHLLKYLNLRNCHISDSGWKFLVKGNWKSLSYFSIENSYVGYDGLNGLVEHNFTNLNILKLKYTQIQNISILNLVKTFQKLELLCIYEQYESKFFQNCKKILSSKFVNTNIQYKQIFN